MNPDPTPTHDSEASFALLTAAGVSNSKAVILASRYNAETVARTLAYAKAQRTARSPVALAVSMLERGDIPPAPSPRPTPGTPPPPASLCDTLRRRWNRPALTDAEVLWIYSGARARDPRDQSSEVCPVDHALSFECEARSLGWTLEQRRDALNRYADPAGVAEVERRWAEVEKEYKERLRSRSDSGTLPP